MASVKFFIKSQTNPATVYLRFVNGRAHDYKSSTGIQVNPKDWNNNKGIIRNVATSSDRDKINNSLTNLRAHLISLYNSDSTSGKLITADWVKASVNSFFHRAESTNLDLFVEYGKHFLKSLPNKINNAKGGSLGVETSTIRKYQSIIRKVIAFEKHRGSPVRISSVNLKFQTEIIDYMRNVEKLSENTVGRNLKFIKTICLDAQRNGVKTNVELNSIKGFTAKTFFVYLNEEEISKIFEMDFSNQPYLQNAKRWFIIGLRTGLRVSDFMRLKSSMIKDGFIQLSTKKTATMVVIPVHPQVKEILAELNNSFPRSISEQKFNNYIKLICRESGITEKVEGSKMSQETKRKVIGVYEKWELISSHVCRRSFATNLYGRIPTPVIMSITGHATEKMFLAYIGKTSMDNAEYLKQFWNEQLNS